MKKSLFLVVLATTLALLSCNGNNNQKIGEADAATGIEVTDTAEEDTTPVELTDVTFIEWTKENCGIDIAYDKNVWLPAYFKLIPEGFEYSMYAKDPLDNMEEMARNFIQQCLDASSTHSVGPDPQCSTIEEVLEHHIKKVYKNDGNPDEGFAFLGEIDYDYNGAKIVIHVNFGQYVKSNNVVYTITRQ